MSALLFSSLDEDGASPLSLSNRALSYGDGIFETIRIVNGMVPLLDYHRARFLRGVEALTLGSSLEMLEQFDHALERAVQKMQLIEHPSGLVKLFAIRREGGRGYAPAQPCVTDIQLQAFELPHYQSEFYSKGIHLKLCDHRLSEQPALAGIKHLNRLDQVLAARELADSPEGLMLDQHNHVVEGTKSNLVVFSGEKIVTPEIVNCGIRGTLLSALLAGEVASLKLHERPITLDDIYSADGLAMINSVFGVWPVSQFEQAEYSISSQCRKLMTAVQERFGFSYEID